MDFVQAIKFPFDDDDWPVKIILGTLICFIPFFAQGYQVRVARNVLNQRKRPLPGTEELGQVFVDGLMAAIAGIIYFLPVILLGCLVFFPAIVLGDSDLGGLAFCGAACCLGLLMLVYALPAAGMYTMGVIRYAESGNFSEFLQISALWHDMTDNLGTLFTLLLYAIGLLLLQSLLSFTVIVTPFLIFFYHVASGYLIGQAGLEIQEAHYA